MTLPTVHDRYSADEIRGFYDNGYWGTESLHALVAAQAERQPDKTFLFDSTTGFTYAELRDSSVRLATALRRHGIERGDRVLVQIPNWAEFAVISVAVARAGAILLPVMPIYRDNEIEYLLQHSGAKMVITCEQFKGFDYLAMYRRLRTTCPEVSALVALRPSAPPDPSVALSFDDLLATPADLELLGPDSGPDEPFLIVYTSGTTSRPKGCLHTVNTCRASAKTIAIGLDYTDSDVQFGPSPISHATGLVTNLFLPLEKGASSHLMEAWEPVEGMRRIQEHGCTVSVSATAFLQMMMSAYDPAKNDLSSMRLWVCAGAPIPGSVVEAAEEMLSGGQVLSLYGRSENFVTTMCTIHDDPARSITSDGSAMRGANVRVVDADGNAVTTGEEGDIAYRGPSHMLCYFRDEEQTAVLFTPDGYSRSGDLGYMDADGFVRVSGRLKDIVIRGGLNISARELEDLLVQHPAIANVAVVGMPDERLGEKVCAYVIPTDSTIPTLNDITSFLRDHNIATPKLPERLEIVDAFPMTATGKIQKHVLRQDVADKLG
ncbi:AMP-binding protein [Prescottella agglutinans]|uniref:Acyl-coenzyme A synthetase/AMP-(Fatty) acid ligase n=1 Tax=Prescottella agglutinans TaxID=1644129 RepID=A0ABT6MK62_9NOCA|nr:AMP-binding protein [Prescottella agglutinans]MDH6284703.1 acyl-coenzyme A synthetase/AMP-(fatty) acid ligase [Prescottella agglutinans]